MRLRKIKLKNFRCYKQETEIHLDDLTVFVGRNDAGKSSIFDALNIFFNEPTNAPDKDDLHVRPDGNEISISCIFEDLPKEVVIDATYPTTLEEEYMLNSEGSLEIKKAFSVGSRITTKIFAIADHPTVQDYNDLLTLNQTNLRKRAGDLNINLSGIDQRINTQIRRAIWRSSGDLQLGRTEIDLSKETAKAIWDKIKPQLPVFALFKSDRPSTDQDAEAQDPMRAAIKEAISGQEEALKNITEKVKNEVQNIANKTVVKIKEMNPELANQLNPRVTTKKWDTLFNVSLTGDDDIPINKRGSGTRRLILLNFFRAKAEQDSEEKGTGVIYAVEEPETSQHPINQKMLIDAFEDLVETENCQVLLSTHTPVLARRFDQKSLRLVTKSNDAVEISPGDTDATAKKIVRTLGVLPDHDVKVFLGVEGKNDIDFLTIISKILKDSGENIPDLGKSEDEGILVFVPLGGSSIELWISRLEGFNRPEFYIIDRDTIPPITPRYQSIADQLNSRANCRAWISNKRELENYIHKDVITSVCPGYAGQGSEHEDVPSLFAQAVHEASDSENLWIRLDEEKKKKKISNAKRRLNTEIVLRMTPDLVTHVDQRDEIRGWLTEIGNALND
jgi:predicted ATP-dependent endonuclease of OLD family